MRLCYRRTKVSYSEIQVLSATRSLFSNSQILHFILSTCGSSYSRTDEVKPFKRCLPQILLGPILEYLDPCAHVSIHMSWKESYKFLFCSWNLNNTTIDDIEKRNLEAYSSINKPNMTSKYFLEHQGYNKLDGNLHNLWKSLCAKIIESSPAQCIWNQWSMEYPILEILYCYFQPIKLEDLLIGIFLEKIRSSF